MSRVVYSVGYGQMQPVDLAELAVGLDAVVVDVRGRPTSRRAGFGRRQLESLLGLHERDPHDGAPHIVEPDGLYTWHGDKLGGLHHLANARTLWPAGVRRMLSTVPRALMLCQCHAPGGCHRHMLASAIHEVDPTIKVVHLCEEESIDARELARAIADDDDYSCYPFEEPRDLIDIWEGP